jgi:CzcA family heavy metal efflux pump
MHEENHHLYLTVTDGRLRTQTDIENLTIAVVNGHPTPLKDVARVERGPEPVFNIVTADGVNAVLLNVRSQPDGSTLEIARALQEDIGLLKKELPPDVKLAFFYDQSVIVRASVKSVWEAILFGLLLSVVIMYAFLKNWGTTLVATLVIPVTVLVTLVAMSLAGMSFNLMTLGGIAAAIGLVIDDAIVVVEAIHTRMVRGGTRRQAVSDAMTAIVRPLVGSTLTPVVVFIPLAFLSDITGVFFRALALTMVVSLLTSLVLALTLTPSLAAWLVRPPSGHGHDPAHEEEGGFVLHRVVRVYEAALSGALRHRFLTLAACLLVLAGGVMLYGQLDSDFLPPLDEGGFVIDYFTQPGTSLTETDRVTREAEKILLSIPEVESYSRRTGARLALAISEPHVGDFLVKLKESRTRTTDDVIADLRAKLNTALPGNHWEFSGALADLIGDLMWSPSPIEVKLFSTDQEFLKKEGPLVEEQLKKIPGVVDTFDGLNYAGPSIALKVNVLEAQRFGLTAADISNAVHTAMIGQTASEVLEGDRLVAIRVLVDPNRLSQLSEIRDLPIRTPTGAIVRLRQVVDISETDSVLELRREDWRQDIAVTARLEGRDLGSAMAEIRRTLDADLSLPPGTIEYGGLYKQQQDSFRNLLVVLAMAIVLVFTVLLVEFRSFLEPVAIVCGATLAMFGSIAALFITHTSLNVVSFLGAIIGVGIVAKNGILMLDLVDHYLAGGSNLEEALIRSGRRRLRPVLMTSMAAALGMLPLAYGIGSGADMLRPLAIAVIGALCVSVLLSLVATPTVYYVLRASLGRSEAVPGALIERP